jgi:ABC-2 type transport system ATP-binding protein
VAGCELGHVPPKVSVHDLKKRYDGVEAARGVSFEIQDAEIFGLIGPNGAGKTTTIECIIGLREPDAGTIEICGIDARRHPRDVKQKIGAALQTTALQDRISAREALALFASFYRQKAAPAELLARFGLEDKADLPFDSLSGGQRQRLALALAFVNRPELVFLDEPTAGLDAQSRRELHAEILRMKREGHTVLLTTHYIEEAETLCDRIAVIDKGLIVASGATPEIVARSSAAPLVSITTVQPFDPSLLSRVDGITDVVCDARSAQFRSPRATAAVTQLIALLNANRIDILELHLQKASLEDVFLELTGAPLDESAQEPRQ